MSKISLDFDAEPDASNSSYDKSLSMETLIGELNQLKEKMNQLQSGNYLQSNANMVTPQLNQASAQLMLKTAEITKDLSLVETNAPYLKSTSQKAYHIWRPSFKYY